MQKAEACGAIGMMVKRLDNGSRIAELQEKYVAADGYGHHFSHYDGSGEEITLGGQDYYVFRVN